MTNHPSAGGSHLPDITVITPVFDNGKLVFFVACRGHHAETGVLLLAGSGAGPLWHGTSGVRCHMTNTQMTDPDIFDPRYPVLLHRF